MTESEAKRRDAILRPYLLGRDWDLDRERGLCRRLVQRSAALLPEHPFLVGYEWEAFSDGVSGDRGDLLFADGQGRLAVVEVKAVANGRQRNKPRRQVEAQAVRFAEAAQSLYPGAKVSAWVFTDDPDSRHVGQEGLRPAEKPAEDW